LGKEKIKREELIKGGKKVRIEEKKLGGIRVKNNV